jgi:hypothetical protein
MKKIEQAGTLLLFSNLIILIILLINLIDFQLSPTVYYFVGGTCWVLNTIAFYNLANADSKEKSSINKSITKKERR